MSFSVQETLFSLLQHNAISGHENAVADVMLCEFRRQAKKRSGETGLIAASRATVVINPMRCD